MSLFSITDAPEMTSSQWWESHRRRYNVALILALTCAIILSIVGFELCRLLLFHAHQRDEVLAFFILAIGSFSIIALANICYLLGAFLEEICRPAKVNAFRQAAYRLGFWFSCGLCFFALGPGLGLYAMAPWLMLPFIMN